MTTRDKRRHQTAVIARRRWNNVTYIVRVEPLGRLRKSNFSCNCWMCSEGDELQKIKLEKRCPWALES